MSISRNASLRLCKHVDYQRVYATSKKQFSRQMGFFFSLRTVERRSVTAGARVGLTVGKVLGNAVERNRIKRRLRECIRRHIDLFRDAPVDVILHPRRSALTLESRILDAEVMSIFHTIGTRLHKIAGEKP